MNERSINLMKYSIIFSLISVQLIASFSKREQESYAQAGSVAEEVLSCIRTVTSLNGQKQDLRR